MNFLFKVLMLILLASSRALFAGAPVLAATPSAVPDLPSRIPLWWGAEQFTGNIPLENGNGNFSEKILYKIYPEPESALYQAKLDFEIPESDQYAFFAAMTHQQVPYTSPVRFRFDQGEWERVEPVSGNRYSWGISNAVDWESLGSRYLTAGAHTFEIEFDRKAPNGNWSFMLDAIFAVREADYRGMNFDRLQIASAKPGEPMPVSFHYSGVSEPLPMCMVLALGPDVVSQQSFTPKPGANEVAFMLPAMLGGNHYTLRITPATAPEFSCAEIDFSIAPAAPSAPTVAPLELKNPSADAQGVTFESDASGSAGIWYFVDGVLYGVQKTEVVAGENRVEFDPGLRSILAGRENTAVALLAYPGKGAEPELLLVHVETSGALQELPKPIQYGIFVDRAQTAHPWFMSQESEYVLDGEVYMPFGGMWCPETLLHANAGEENDRAHFEHDRKTLDTLREYGINDVYLNMSTPAPLRLRQFMIDELESRGVEYGYQTGASWTEIPAYFITREREVSGWVQPLTGTYEDKVVTVMVPRSYQVAGFLVMPESPEPGWCRFFNFLDTEGRNTRHHIIDLETKQDFGDNREVRFASELPEGTRKLTVIPLIQASMHNSNLWDPEVMEKTFAAMEWLGQMKWGPHFRFVVDPILNETDMLNASCNLRMYTAPINACFATWLEEKYTSLAALRKAWAMEVPDFAAASRLVPLRTGEQIAWVDPELGTVLMAPVAESLAWLDYNDMIRETYSALADRVAQYIKTLVDVPIVYKSVGVAGEKMNTSMIYGGADGIGYEIYLNGGIPGETGGGASTSEVETSAHTMWKVGTELGHSFEVGNGGVKFFADEAEIRGLTQSLLNLGVKGFYYFGLDLKPGNLWGNHNYHDFPAGLGWVRKIQQDVEAGVLKGEARRKLYTFPGGNTFWWWCNRFSVMYDDMPNQFDASVRLARNSDEWFTSTFRLPAKFDMAIINCANPPYSKFYASQIADAIAGGNPVWYVGFRNDLGTIPELDVYFTGEYADVPGLGRIQKLRMLPNVKILAEVDGEPWSIQVGNLRITALTPEKIPHGSAQEWMDKLPR